LLTDGTTLKDVVSLKKLGVLLLCAGCATSLPQPDRRPDLTWDQGAITRGPQARRELALVFTGGSWAEGATEILDALAARGVKASFFVTGDFLRTPEFDPYLRRMVRDGHYLGPHSDAHLLYAPWEDRARTIVSQDSFTRDLERNLSDIVRYTGARMRYFIPPYEWYNQQIADWTRARGIILFNYSPGTRSNADYMLDDDPRFIASQAIYDGILEYERTRGLNGFLLLLHVGAGPGRTDKMHRFVAPLVDELTRRGYRFRRVDELLRAR
jgi:peptidoglycan/xylan/chitin deacetylase (PgdA/CDA1 family)